MYLDPSTTGMTDTAGTDLQYISPLKIIIIIISSNSSSSSNDIFPKAYLMYCKSVPAVSVISVVLGSKYNGERIQRGQTYSTYAFRNISLLLLLLLKMISSNSSSSSSNDIFPKAYLMYCKYLDPSTTGTELTVHQICFKEYIKDPSTTGMTDTAGTAVYLELCHRNLLSCQLAR